MTMAVCGMAGGPSLPAQPCGGTPVGPPSKCSVYRMSTLALARRLMPAAASSEPEKRVTLMSSTNVWVQSSSKPSNIMCTLPIVALASPWTKLPVSTGKT